MFFSAEGADHRNTGQYFSCNKIQPVDQCLKLCKSGHCNGKQKSDDNKNQHNAHTKDPCHGRICFQHTKHSSDSNDRSIQNNTEHHCHSHLYLLHIIGASGDQRCRGKFVVLIAGKSDYLPVNISSDIMAQTCSHLCRKENYRNRSSHNKKRHQDHFQSRFSDVFHLKFINILAKSLILGLYIGNSRLGYHGIRHVPEFFAHALCHLRSRILRHLCNSLHRICSFRYSHLCQHFPGCFIFHSQSAQHQHGFSKYFVEGSSCILVNIFQNIKLSVFRIGSFQLGNILLAHKKLQTVHGGLSYFFRNAILNSLLLDAYVDNF